METFTITYNGEKLEAQKDNKGKFYIKFPARIGKNGENIYETIEKDLYGWRYSAMSSNDEEKNSFDLWLLNGSNELAYRNTLEEGMIFSGRRFEPEQNKDDDVVSEIARKIYDIKNIVLEQEKIGTEILELRKQKLYSVLKLLGFSNTWQITHNLDNFDGYKVLGRLGKELENYRNLAFIRSKEMTDGTEEFDFNIPVGLSDEAAMKMKKEVEKEVDEDLEFMKNQEDIWDFYRQNVNPDFALNMSKKVSKSDWLLYSKVVKKTAKLYLALNADLITEGERILVDDFTSLQGDELDSKISELIDTREFDEACNIEDKFINSELENVCEKINSIENGNSGKDNRALWILLESVKREALNTRDKRARYNKRYEEMEGLCSALLDTNEIRISGKNTQEGRMIDD